MPVLPVPARDRDPLRPGAHALYRAQVHPGDIHSGQELN